MNVQECVEIKEVIVEARAYPNSKPSNNKKLFKTPDKLKSFKLYSYDRSGLDKNQALQPSFLSNIISAIIALIIILYLLV